MRVKLCFTTIFIIFSTGLFSAPRIINDNRVESLNGFPTLGRGYSINSNHLQSMCFKSVTTTKPTFDLSYDIEEVTEDYLTKLLVSGRDRIQNTKLNKFIKSYYNTEEKSGNIKYTLKNLIVRAEVNQYYSSIDETQSVLSDSVTELLKKKQYVTFFNSCGHFYVRSIGTFSTYYALLQYRLTGDGDDEFRGKLEKGLFNFYEESQTAAAAANKKDEKKEKPQSQEYANLSEDAQFRGLKVYVQGIGLSKGDPVNLIPVNIKQFRTTIQEAVKLMQSPDSGLVNSIEVVPWMENPEFGKILLSDDSNGGAEQFIRQQKIEENTGVITEIYRKSKSQLELYNVSSMCRKIIVDEYADKSSGSLYRSLYGQGIQLEEKKKEFTLVDESIIRQLIDKKIRKFDGNRTLFYNLFNENDKNGYITLNDYIKYFHGNPPERFLEINRYYLYGENNDGALDCINKLQDKLDEASYREIPSCLRALKDVELNSSFFNQYCLPKPVKVVYEDEKKEREENRNKPSHIDTINTTEEKKDIKDTSLPDTKKETNDKKNTIESFQDISNPKQDEKIKAEEKKETKDTSTPDTKKETNDKKNTVESLQNISNPKQDEKIKAEEKKETKDTSTPDTKKETNDKKNTIESLQDIIKPKSEENPEDKNKDKGKNQTLDDFKNK